jgi:hypothetical protein
MAGISGRGRQKLKQGGNTAKQTGRKGSPIRSVGRADLVIYGICIAGVLVFLNFFRIDLFKTLTRQSERPIGTITFKYKAAQRRFVDRVLWDRLRRHSPVYDGDFIRTAELSEATITFNEGGTVIDLDESSLVQLHRDKRGARINIGEGGVSAAAADSGVVLVLGNSQVAVETGAVVNAGTENGDLLFRVMEGSASVTGGGESRTAEAGETFALGEGGLQAVQGITALSPRPAARFLNPGPGKLAVSFRWNRTGLNPEERVRLEIAEDRGFARIVFGEDTAEDTVTAELETGSYFWRLSPADSAGDGPVPTFLSFKVIASSAPVLISPAEDYQYQFRIRRPTVRFQWTETDDAASCLLEVADNPEMTNPVLSQEVQGTSFYFPAPGPGIWYWRVRPVFPSGYEGTVGEGVPASFRVTQGGSLTAPELRSPEDRGTVTVTAGREDLYFSWRTEEEARSYTIRVSADRNLADPFVNETVVDNFYVYRAGQNTVKPGQYYWAVLQTDVEGNDSALSPVWSFTVLEGGPVQRLVFPPDGYIIEAVMLPDMRFVWKTNLPYQTRFQLSGRADFSRTEIDEEANSESFQGRLLSDGTWYWRIQAKDPGGRVFETSPKTFIVESPLSSPVLVTPRAGGRVAVQEGEPVLFSWEPLPGVEYYQLKLYHSGDQSGAVYEDNQVEGTSRRVFMDAYPEGDYYWTVTGVTPEGALSIRRTSPLSKGAFVARKLHPVSLDYPGDGAELEGLKAYREPGMVRWSSQESIAASRFILSRNRDFTGQPVVFINNPSRAIPLPQLREGDYYWTIRAETEDGLDISAKAPRLFRVLPMPPLPKAENRLPRDGTIITGEELRHTRQITFSWDAVPEASRYLFTIEHVETGNIVVQRGPFPETACVLEDLTLLDLGTFIWRVEAVLTRPVRERREEEETEEIIRRGESGENRLILDFILPDTPKLQKPGLLYGREQD